MAGMQGAHGRDKAGFQTFLPQFLKIGCQVSPFSEDFHAGVKIKHLDPKTKSPYPV